jgi:triacylglycerol lipase
MALLVVAAGCTPAPGASPRGALATPVDRGRPVVIVPGWELACETRRTDWDEWIAALVDRGLPREHVRVAFYDTCRSNLETAAMIGRTVAELLEKSGADKVHVIAHSMGAIPARWCIRFGGCAGKVDQVVTLAGANHGTIWAGACAFQFWAVSCADMQPESPILTKLNTDEAPVGIGWETWVSICELVILPRESAFLRGAVNHDLTDDCVDHSGWKRHRPTIEAVTARLVPPRAATVGG